MITVPPLQQIDRTYVRYRGKKLSYFSGCDYFRLSTHPEILRAIREGLDEFGLNVAASRITTGNHEVYLELERRLARYFRVERAVLLNSGYAANLALAQSWAVVRRLAMKPPGAKRGAKLQQAKPETAFTHLLIDDRAHASLTDAAACLDCSQIRFRHRDVDDVKAILKRLGASVRPLLITDGMFAQDGSVAPLDKYLAVLPARGGLLVDDAHAAGVLGKSGRGSLEYCGVRDRRIFQTVTLSKAFGVYGGAVLGNAEVGGRVVKYSRLYAGNTPIPLPLAHGAIAAIGLLERDPTLRAKLLNNVASVKRTLLSRGYPVCDNPSPIVPWIPKTRGQIAALSKKLLSAGIYPPFIKYPGAPALGYFRFALSSEHSRAQLDRLLEVLTALKI